MSREEQWLLCPVCGAKTRLRLLQRTVLREFPALLPQMQARERDQRKKFSDRNRLSARRKDAVLTTEGRGQHCVFLMPEKGGNRET